MAKDLAREIGYIYVDTGAMYRSVTLYALRHQLFNEDGSVIPVTVIEAGPCPITQKKTADTDGYEAVQLSFEDIREKLVSKPAADN